MDDAQKAGGRRRAPIRLRHLAVHAVALVADGANLRTWAEVRKARTMDDTTSKILTLPRAAQEGLIQGITQSIEALTAVLDVVQGAQIAEGDGAVVPPEISGQLEQIGTILVALGDQYDVGGPPPPEMASEEMALTPEEMGLAKMVAKGVAHNLVALGGRVAKGKVKMTFEQLMKLHAGITAKLYEIARELAPLVAAGEGGDVAVAEVLGVEAPAAKSGEVLAPAAKGASQGETAVDATTTADSAAAIAALTKTVADMQSEIRRIGKQRLPPTAAPAHENMHREPAPLPYGEDLAQRVRAREAGAKQ